MVVATEKLVGGNGHANGNASNSKALHRQLTGLEAAVQVIVEAKIERQEGLFGRLESAKDLLEAEIVVIKEELERELDREALAGVVRRMEQRDK